MAIELAEGPVPYYAYDFPEKVCLIVGHEDHGVTKATLAVCDAAVLVAREVVAVAYYVVGRGNN